MVAYQDLREFLEFLKKNDNLKTIDLEINPILEITEISDRFLQKEGEALLFTNVKDKNKKYDIPCLTNLFGTVQRVAFAMGETDINKLREIGKLLAYLKEPEPPQGFKDAISKIPLLKKLLTMSPKVVKKNKAPCQEHIFTGDDVNLYDFPIQTCWTDDVAPLITWGLVVSKGLSKKRQNLGIYRQQVLAKNKVIMRWLAHRGGALDLKEWQEKKTK